MSSDSTSIHYRALHPSRVQRMDRGGGGGERGGDKEGNQGEEMKVRQNKRREENE